MNAQRMISIEVPFEWIRSRVMEGGAVGRELREQVDKICANKLVELKESVQCERILDPIVEMFGIGKNFQFDVFGGKKCLKFSHVYASERFQGLSRFEVEKLIRKDSRFECVGDWSDWGKKLIRLKNHFDLTQKEIDYFFPEIEISFSRNQSCQIDDLKDVATSV